MTGFGRFVSATLLAVATLQGWSLAAAQVHSNHQDNAGRYERVQVHGSSLEGNLERDNPTRAVSVYLPPSYDREAERRYPVLYLLHGFTDSDERWFGLAGEHFVNVPDAMDAAWEQGAAEMIVVMPNAFTRFWGSMYSTSATTGDWQAYIARDLVSWVDGNYRTLPERASRGLAGHSMGGYGALRIGMKYPEVFGALYALSPCCMAPVEPDPGAFAQLAQIDTEEEIASASFSQKAMLASAAAWSPNPRRPPLYLDLPVQDGEVRPDIVALWSANAPLALVHQHLPQLRSFSALHFDAGDGDTRIAATVRELDALLNDYGVAHVAEEYQGDHVSRIHARLISHVMPMFTQALKTE